MNSEQLSQTLILRSYDEAVRDLFARFGEGLKIRGRNSVCHDLRANIFENKENMSKDEPLHWPIAHKSIWFNPRLVDLFDAPFPFLVGNSPLDNQSANDLLVWLESIDKWKLNEGEFYASSECNLLALPPPKNCSHLFSDSVYHAFSLQASSLFGTTVVLTSVLAAHRMTLNQGVGIHSDAPSLGEETHRIVYTFTRNSTPQMGGHFVFFSGKSPQEATHLIPLRSNQAIAFPMSSTSYHAVTTITGGERYSIVASFCSS